MADAAPKTREGASLTLRRVPLADLVEDPRNARLHDERNLAGIRSSLENFGQREPLVVRDGVVIGGNGRLRVMRDLGWDEVWVTDHDDLTEAQARALGVVLNRTAEVGTSWHAENLRLAVEEVALECPEIDLDVGDVPEIEPPKPEPTEDDGAPEPLPESATQRGDLICLGPHRVMCGDSTSAEDVGALLAGETPGLMVTDPPYSSGGRQEGQKRHSSSIGTRSDGQIARDNLTTRGYCELIRRVCQIWNAHTVYMFTDWRMWTPTFDILESCGLPVRNMLVWDKQQMGMGFPWRAQHELIAFAKQAASQMGDGKRGNVLGCPRSGNKNHETEKPVALIADLISNGDCLEVVDPFLGSGTTLIAADQLGRTCYGMELEPRYVDVIVRRWIAYCEKAGKDPEVIGWRGDER